MKTEEYFKHYCLDNPDPLSVLALDPADESFRKQSFSGPTVQTSKSIEGKKELSSEWTNGQRDGRVFLRDEYGEDLMSCSYKGGLLHGMCVFRGLDCMYLIEYEEGHPTGRVQYTMISTGTQWQCVYESGNTIRELKCLRGSEAHKFPLMKCMDSIHPKKVPEAYNIQPITVDSTFTNEKYNASIARSVWLKSLSRVRKLQHQPNGESGECSKLNDFIQLYEKCMTVYDSINKRVKDVMEKWNQKKRSQQANEKGIKKRTIEEETKTRQVTPPRPQSTQKATLHLVPQRTQPVMSPPQNPRPITPPPQQNTQKATLQLDPQRTQPATQPPENTQQTTQPSRRSRRSRRESETNLTNRQPSEPQPRRGNLNRELREEKVVPTKADIAHLKRR